MQILQGDCLIELKKLEDNSVDSVVTDPPYELGFMGKKWDNTGIAYNPDMWAECLRVLKPGGHLLSFSGTRTYHRMAVAIEDAGFEIRDMVEWVYGSGFPKSLNIGKAVDKIQGNEREVVGTVRGVRGADGTGHENAMPGKATGVKQVGIDLPLTKGTSPWEGWGTALKPAHEPICLARKPIEGTVANNVLKYGTGGLNIDKSRVGTETAGWGGNGRNTEIYGEYKDGQPNPTTGRFPANLIHDGSDEVVREFPNSKSNGEYKKTGDWENTGDGKIRTWDIGYDKLNKYAGQDGSAARFFKSFHQETSDSPYINRVIQKDWFLYHYNDIDEFKSIFYCPKASKSERDRGCEGMEETIRVRQGLAGEKKDTSGHNSHPTVKPLALMKYLIEMITPPGGTVLDPFAGSGSTLVAAKELGYDFIGIEMTEEYIPIIEARLNAVKDKLL